jgi:hypothetical protein
VKFLSSIVICAAPQSNGLLALEFNHPGIFPVRNEEGVFLSKLDRQLNDVFRERRVDIHWPNDEEVDVDLLRLHLISEIDSHSQRIPLDLRGVHDTNRTVA